MVFSTILQKETSDIKNIVLYTRSSMYSNHDIPRFYCSNEDTYIEIVFQDNSTLCIGGYMKYTWENERIKDDVQELLDRSSIITFHESELYKKLTEKYV